MMISGSCLKNDFNAAAKVNPISFLTFTWLIPSRLNSTGSSAVEIFESIVFNSANAEYSVVVFPEPVGPVTRHIP